VAASSDRGDSFEVVPVRRRRTWVLAGVIIVGALVVAQSLATNKAYQWDVVGQYFLSEPILTGLELTLLLTVLAMGAGIVLGSLIAMMRVSNSPILRAAGWMYVSFFRGTPLLVQLIFWYNLATLYPQLSLRIPFGPELFAADTNRVVTPFVAAMLGLGLNEAAYMAEIVRAGIQSVDPGQSEAAASLGLSTGQTMRRIVLPQAMRVIIPPTGNETIAMLKTTSLVSVISLSELLYSAQLIYSQSFQTIPLLIVASGWYLIVTTVLTIGQSSIERKYARGASRAAPPTLVGRLWRFARPGRLLP